MNDRPLVSAAELADLLAAGGQCVIFDCRFDLRHPEQGRNSWLAGHIPGAVYAHLDEDLAGTVTSSSGRHPVPHARSFASFLARSGWAPGLRIVAYDAQGGALAARLWWLMKYFGHDCVALLDGGIKAWTSASGPLEAGPVTPQRQPFTHLRATQGMALDSRQVADGLADGSILLLDARAADRFQGLAEPLDTKAGHIPGARNLPFQANLREGYMRQPAELRRAFKQCLGERDPSAVVHMCGSGVTACHNMLAMELAGLGGSRLYPGSWSEWIRDPGRPAATGGA